MKRRAVNDLLVIKQNIKIQRPWSPVNYAFPVCLLLQLMQALKRFLHHRFFCDRQLFQ